MERTHRRSAARGPSWRLLAALGLLLAVAVSCTVLFVVARSTFDPEARAAAAAARYRQEERAQRLEALDTAVAAGWRVLPLLLVCGASVVALRVAWARWGATPAVYADKQAAMARALTQRYPAGLQSLALHDSSRRELGPPAALPGLPELPAPSIGLPNVALLADALTSLPRGKLAYGKLPGGESLVLTFGQAYHALAAGDTRTGKSNYLDSIITQLHYQSRHYELRLLIGDFKREMAATWRRSPLVETVETDPTAIGEVLIELAHGKGGILDRYAQFERLGEQQGRIIRNIGDWCRVTGEQPRLVFCVIDELNALIEACDRKDALTSALKVVLQTGAGAGVYVLGGAQYLTARTLGRDGSKQFTTRAMFGAFDGTAAGMLFGQGKIDVSIREQLTGQPGRGLIRTAGQAQPTPFQALRCDEEDILGAVRLLTNDQPTMLRLGEPAEPLNGPRTASEPAEPAFVNGPISPEMGQLIRRLANQGWSKTKVIETLFNVKRGGSEAYKTLSAAYDQLIMEGRS